MLIGGAVVGVDAGEGVVIVVLMGGGRYMRDGGRSYWTFEVMGELGIERMMVIGVPICERILASWSPGITLYSASQIQVVHHIATYP